MLRWIYISAAFAGLYLLSVTDYIPTADLFDFLPGGVVYFINYFKIPTGLNLIIGAYFIKFFVRRVHLIS